MIFPELEYILNFQVYQKCEPCNKQYESSNCLLTGQLFHALMESYNTSDAICCLNLGIDYICFKVYFQGELPNI